MSQALAWPVIFPLAGGCATLLLGGRAGERGLRVLVATTWAAVFLSVAAVVVRVWTRGTLGHELGGWAAPLGIGLRADGLTAALLLATAVTSLGIGVYAPPSFRAPDEDAAARGSLGSTAGVRSWRPGASFWTLALFLWAALNALFLSADLFNVYVCLELLTLAAVAMVLLAGDRVALFASMRYLLAAFLGSMLFLLGVAFLYGVFDTLDLGLLRERMVAGTAAWTGIALVTGGLALKTALFPLHFWLPRAHASAPAPVSAALSALVVTGSYYLILRLWLQVFTPALTGPAAQAMGAMGAGAILWGSLQAIRQQHLKLMIAYSTVAQVGYLFILVPLVVAQEPGGGPPSWAFDAWSGGIYHAVSHAFAKAAMFMAAGSIVRALGHDRIVGISGIASHLPLSTYAFGLAGLTLIGLPPSGGFVAKWLLLTAALAGGQWWWAAVLLVGGILTAGYVFLVLGQELSQDPAGERPDFAPVPRVMEVATMALALCGFVMGIRAVEPLALLGIGSPIPGVTP